MIKNVKLFVNKNDKSISVAKLVKEKFEANKFNIVEDNFNLAVAVGGDGSFLRMVKETDFNSNPYYIGINAGTLGFLQEVKIDEIDKLIDEIKRGNYKIADVGIQETYVNQKDKLLKFYSLNEILIRDKNLKALKVAVKIDNDLLENYTGDGLLIATSLGSTAHNLSYGGSIVYNNFETLQITPIAPINSVSYRSLFNSVIIPDQKEIVIKGNDELKDLLVTIDGENHVFDNVESINTSIKDKKIKVLRFSHYNFPQKINEKLLSK